MKLRFLIDECLTPELAQMAVEAGYEQSTSVRDRGWSGTSDWKLIEHVVAGDFTLVTHNAVDFRGSGPGQLGGQHAKQAIHAGLVCLGSAKVLDLQRQCRLFRVALNELAALPDLVNQALEVFECAEGSLGIVLYEIPDAYSPPSG